MRDTENVEVFFKEYRDFEKSGMLPRFIVMCLGENHTRHDARRVHTRRVRRQQRSRPRPDRRRGQQSRFWKEMAIFVIEDDAQNGPDHVDAHRTVGLVISPYCKRRTWTARSTRPRA